MEEKQALILEVYNETGIDFFDAVRRFYEYIEEDLLSYVPFNEEQLENCPMEQLKELVKNLKDIINNRLHRREAIDWKKIAGYINDSIARCNWLRRRDTTSEAYLIMKNFIDEDKLRYIITRNPHKWWNPLMIMNWVTWVVPCIFLPSKALRDRYDFISIDYNPDKSIRSVWIDVKRLQTYDTVFINEDDIVSFFYGLYHPYVWWLVQSKQRRLLVYENN